MDINLFTTTLSDVLKKNGIRQPTDLEARKLFLLTEIMLKTNSTMNLTAIVDPIEILVKHYADCLTILNLIPEHSKLLDVGCGAGFPSLPLAIFRPDISITSLDSTAKKIEYIRSTAKLLELDNITCIAARAEDLAHKAEFREKYDIVTARAVANMQVLSELCVPFVKKGGKFIAMKGQKCHEEFEAARKTIEVCGGTLSSLNLIKLTYQDIDETRSIIGIQKTSATPQKYPRQYARIIKSPL